MINLANDIMRHLKYLYRLNLCIRYNIKIADLEDRLYPQRSDKIIEALEHLEKEKMIWIDKKFEYIFLR